MSKNEEIPKCTPGVILFRYLNFGFDSDFGFRISDLIRDRFDKSRATRRWFDSLA